MDKKVIGVVIGVSAGIAIATTRYFLKKHKADDEIIEKGIERMQQMSSRAKEDAVDAGALLEEIASDVPDEDIMEAAEYLNNEIVEKYNSVKPDDLKELNERHIKPDLKDLIKEGAVEARSQINTISMEDYSENPKYAYYERHTCTYYADEDILADLDNGFERIPNIDDRLTSAIHFILSHSENELYVADDDNKILYEIIIDNTGSSYEEDLNAYYNMKEDVDAEE